MEFVIAHSVQVHPMALLRPDRISDPEAQMRIAQLTEGYRTWASNIAVTIPFCRSVGEADRVLEAMAANGLERGPRSTVAATIQLSAK